MGILDKLKPLPRWKNANPSVRQEAVRELEDPAELALLAETDPDARVRRAAVAKTADVAVLGRIAQGDSDTETQDRAADRLSAIAASPSSQLDEALAAARALTDQRRLSTLAKGDAPEAVCAEILPRIAEERALSSIARHARHETIARAALDRLTDAGELIEVAQNAEHKDVALRAFNRVVSPAPELSLLRTIEARAQQKAVSKRARALIQEIEAAEAARRAAEEDHRRQQAGLCEAVEQLASLSADVALVRAELTRLADAWSSLGVTDQAALDRFSRGEADALATIARREHEMAEAAERTRQRVEAIATREALCARVETLDGDDVAEQLIPIEEEWRSLSPVAGNGVEADRLAGRFAQAVADCRRRHELRATAAATLTKLEALVAEAETLPSHADQTSTAARWQALNRDGRLLVAALAEANRPAEELAARLAAVDHVFVGRETARRDAAVKIQQDQITQLHRLTERARRAAEAETVTLREGDRLMRDISTGLEVLGRGELSRDLEDAAKALRAQQEKIAPRVRELREMDEWRRFANAQRQEQLIAMAEAIVASLKTEEEAAKPSNLAATARALRELHTKWQEVAEAPRNSAQRLWDRFRTATDFIRSRCEVYFAKMREERGASLQKRAAIVEAAEALTSSADWGKATARFQELQNEWQQAGPMARDAGRELAHRFRAACNTFFSRRREDLTERKKAWTDNLARKEALCERAETLAESTDWEAASSEMKRLQAEWKTIGPVRRNKSEVVWNRFRAAADRFFERFHNRHQITLQTKLAERETLVVEFEGLVASGGESGAPEGLRDRVQQLRTQWNRSVPIPAAEMKALNNRWNTASAQVVTRWTEAFKGTDLDPAATYQRMEKLVARVEALLADVREPATGLSQAEILAARLRSALASNAMGGRANDESKWRAAADTVKDAQNAWSRLAPLSGPEARALETRFREACRRVSNHARRHTSSSGAPAKRPAPRQAVGV